MSIIPIKQALTVNDYVAKIKSGNLNLYKSIKTQHDVLFNMIWNNTSFTAKEIIDGFGTDAAMLFQLSSTIQSLLVSVDSSYVPLTPKFAYVINQDGTVTVDMNTPT